MGHFGPLPIRVAWFGIALPALTLNYFGQGAWLLSQPTAMDGAFYALVPHWAHYSVVVLATAATVIAAQSIISGAYSLTQQAIRLGFLPRMSVVHTARGEIGQIYMPFVNWVLAIATLTAVIGFGSSDALAGAYGIAVSLLMVITTMMATFVALHWKYNLWLVLLLNGSLLAIDLLFFASTSTKFFDGGWFPLLIAAAVSFIMLTWRKGEEILDSVRLKSRQRTKEFIEGIESNPPVRLPGTAIVLGRMAQGVPLALTQNLKYNRVLHERVLLVAITTDEVPRVADAARATVTELSDGLTRVELHFGFMEHADVPAGLRAATASGKIGAVDLEHAIYFTGHETIIAAGRSPRLARWRESLFALLKSNAQRSGTYFKIPSHQIMEIGVEFEI
jgi:KUP system potassium uptake protein